MPIFRVKSVKNYTGQKNLHGYTRGAPDKYQVWALPPLIWTKSKRTATFFRETSPYAANLLFHGQNCLEMDVGSLWLDINKVSNPCSGYISNTLNFNANKNSESQGGSIINLSMIQSCL